MLSIHKRGKKSYFPSPIYTNGLAMKLLFLDSVKLFHFATEKIKTVSSTTSYT